MKGCPTLVKEVKGMEEDVRSRKSIIKKVAKIVLKIMYQILVVLCLIVSAVIIFQKITDSNRSIAGYRIFRVITGSMEPEYDVGEVVISKEVDPNNIKVGDDIVYLGTYGEYSGKIIMHTVVAIDKDENGNLNFHAKGLHSASVEDPQIKASQIYGVVQFKSVILTVLYKVATNIYSLFVIITVLALNVFISFRMAGKEKVHQLGEPANTGYRTHNVENLEYEDAEDENYDDEEEYEDGEIYEEETEETEDTENELDDENDNND